MGAADQLRDKWESISSRERRLVLLLGVSFVVVMVLYFALGIKDGLDKLEKKNAQARTALHKLTAYKASARTVGGDDPTAIIGTEPVKLESYIYKAGEAAQVTVPGVNPRSPVTRGKFVVHSAQIDVRDLTIKQVTDFLYALENESRVVMVTTMSLKRNFRDAEKMDLSAEIAAYSRVAESAGATAGSGSGSGTGATGGAR